MITHCPSCHTHFRVHAEQLAARAGQVRCGKCSRIFDALEHLIEEVSPARAPRSPAEPEAAHVEIANASRAADPAARETEDLGPEAPGYAVEQAADFAALATERATEPREAAFAQPVPAESASVDAAASAFDFGPVAIPEPDKPRRSGSWLLGALLLLLLLLAQAAYHYRSAITLLLPQTKPYAVALCATLGCELPLPRRIEQMSIEASDLQADTTNPSVMVLSATLKNRAIFSQQYPSLELTLTDAQDQPVVRRVLAPQDYLGKTVDVQAGVAANSEFAIKVFIEGAQVKATGYRLYLFYP